MARFRVWNKITGIELGVYHGITEHDALVTFALLNSYAWDEIGAKQVVPSLFSDGVRIEIEE